MIDVVEGTAMDALSSMQSVLRGRPKTFPSLTYAIEWSVRSGQVRNVDSARVSMPGQLKSTATGKCAVYDVAGEAQAVNAVNEVNTQKHQPIAEEQEEGSTLPEEKQTEFKVHSWKDSIIFWVSMVTNCSSIQKPEVGRQQEVEKSKGHPFEWRIDLASTEQYWTGWFKGLSAKFLTVPASM